MGSKNWAMKKSRSRPSTWIALEGEIKEQEVEAVATPSRVAKLPNELDQLQYQMDYLLSSGAREEAKSLASTQSLVALEGWIETSQVAPHCETSCKKVLVLGSY